MNKNKRYPALFMAPGVLIYGVFFILPKGGSAPGIPLQTGTLPERTLSGSIKIYNPSIKRALLNTIILPVVTTVGMGWPWSLRWLYF